MGFLGQIFFNALSDFFIIWAGALTSFLMFFNKNKFKDSWPRSEWGNFVAILVLIVLSILLEYFGSLQ